MIPGPEYNAIMERLKANPYSVERAELNKITGSSERTGQILQYMGLKHPIAEDDQLGVFILPEREKLLAAIRPTFREPGYRRGGLLAVRTNR